MTLAERLHHLLNRSGLNPVQLAQKSGIHLIQIHGYLRGSHAPNLRNARKLVRALGVGLDEFLDVVLPQDARARQERSCKRRRAHKTMTRALRG
jgi:transcriptional regulator with XRE-family HTH domain